RAAEGAAVAVDPAFEAAVKLGGGDREADREAEKTRLLKQLEEARKGLEATEKRLANPQFVERAKPEVVEGARKQAEGLRATIASAEERLGALG
ncbi:MAG: hypothetical protein HC897_17195, partial [Thermoanaerobaculia bacterium]|nr:hypothetical protein [Thermoanaerobaculia bacterium]